MLLLLWGLLVVCWLGNKRGLCVFQTQSHKNSAAINIFSSKIHWTHILLRLPHDWGGGFIFYTVFTTQSALLTLLKMTNLNLEVIKKATKNGRVHARNCLKLLNHKSAMLLAAVTHTWNDVKNWFSSSWAAAQLDPPVCQESKGLCGVEKWIIFN